MSRDNETTSVWGVVANVLGMIFVAALFLGIITAAWSSFWNNWAHDRDEARKEAARCKFVDLGVTSKNTDRMLRCPHKNHTLSLAPFSEGMIHVTCSCADVEQLK